jgi:hypothetical protein
MHANEAQGLGRFVKTAIIGGLSALSFLGITISSGHAQTVIDPLLGFCNGTAPAGACADNGTNTPLGANSTNFGFSISPGPQTGDLLIDILVPNNYAHPTTFAITGTQGGTANNQAISATANLFSTTAWTSGQLDAYLGISASPTNPIGAYLPSTQALDAAATGFFVFQADLGQTKIWDNPNETNGPNLNLIAGLGGDLGAYIVAFCGIGCTDPVVATANSGALLLNSPPTPPSVPEPGTLLVFGGALLGLVLLRRRWI